MPPILSGRHYRQLITTDCQVDKLTHRILILDHHVEIRDKLCRIIHSVGIVTTTVESDSDLTVLHGGDVLDGAGLELESHDQIKK